jgi:Fe-S cluster assembly protein SufD
MPEGARRALARFEAPAASVVLCNGRVVHLDLDADLAARGVRLEPVDSRADEEDVDDVGEPDRPYPDQFAALNEAFAPQPLRLVVPRGVEVDGPVVVVSWAQTDGLATFTRFSVVVEQAGAVEVIEVQGGGDVHALTVPVTRARVARDARLSLVTVQERGPRTWHLAQTDVTVEQQGTARLALAAMGGSYARARTTCRLVGRGATGELLAAYFGRGEQTLDFRTFQHHEAPDTSSDLLFAGAVDDRSRSIYTGLIKVGKDARGTNAFQTNRNIKLSDDAWAESVPNLEIEQNDVRCSHASVVGPIDEDQRFYLESRGVRPEVAERLIVAGFFEEVLRRLPVPAARPTVRADLLARLDARESA